MARSYTVADLAQLPDDGKKYELIRGELVVSPAPALWHQMIVSRLTAELLPYLKQLGLADTFFAAAADISWDERNLVQPDLLVIHPGDFATNWREVKRLRLAVEVVSPSSRRRDRLDKRTLYQENAVQVYWVVDPESQLVERWLPNDSRHDLITGTLEWQVEPSAPVLSLDVPTLFANLPN